MRCLCQDGLQIHPETSRLDVWQVLDQIRHLQHGIEGLHEGLEWYGVTRLEGTRESLSHECIHRPLLGHDAGQQCGTSKDLVW